MDNKKEFQVIDKRKAYRVEKQIHDNEQRLNNLCAQLAKIDSFFPVDTVKGVKQISSKWLRSYIDGILASIKSDQRLPQSFKDDITERWEKVWESAHDLCDQVSLIANFKGVTLRKRNGVFLFDVQELKAFAEKEATVTLTGEQAEYLSKLQAVAKSLNDASEWEKAHGYMNTTANGANVDTINGEYRHMNLLDLLLLSDDDGGHYDITPQSFVLMEQDKVIGKEE